MECWIVYYNHELVLYCIITLSWFIDWPWMCLYPVCSSLWWCHLVPPQSSWLWCGTPGQQGVQCLDQWPRQDGCQGALHTTTGNEVFVFMLYFQILSCAWQNDVNMCARQENWQCEHFACSRQKDVNDKNFISIIVNKNFRIWYLKTISCLVWNFDQTPPPPKKKKKKERKTYQW